MSIQDQPSLTDFAEWIAATDPHASQRMPLVDQASKVLAGTIDLSFEERELLADKIERWRYQTLNHRPHALTAKERSLMQVLDLTSNELAQRRQRAHRAPRSALQASGDLMSSPQLTEESGPADFIASSAFDVPLDELVRQAAACTDRHFSGLKEPGADGSSQVVGGAMSGEQAHNTARRMLLYAPLYLSSHCINHCRYCGFQHSNDLEREHLTPDEALRQAEILHQRGHRHLLLVAGDFPRLTSTGYFSGIIRDLVKRGFSVAVEVAAQSTASYAELVRAGVCGVTLYQETYDEQLYADYHPRGSKVWFDWRLEAPERAAEAGIGRLGLGVLLGLAEPKQDVLAMIRHAHYLQSRFPDVRLAFSLPRIHEAPKGFVPACQVDDDLFVRLYCAVRLAFPEAHLLLSTRESAALRNRMTKICITQMSAGSSTAPGGYQSTTNDHRNRQQFPVSDDRSPSEMAGWLSDAGFEVNWIPEQ
ncbi:MAG: radical SAM protein [Fuerstiella sp.]|nr:radical SAM protein [Fuerstiella sp.]MCP4857506.1 radical SAM protein [Fuerstiella sp.]